MGKRGENMWQIILTTFLLTVASSDDSVYLVKENTGDISGVESHLSSTPSGNITDKITEIITSTVRPIEGSEVSFQRAVRQIAILDSLSCLPRFLCGLSTRPSAKTGIVNDYGYLMKILFERDDDDDDEDDEDDDTDKKKKKQNIKDKSRTGAEDPSDVESSSLTSSSSNGNSTAKTAGAVNKTKKKSKPEDSSESKKNKKKKDGSEEDSNESGNKSDNDNDDEDEEEEEEEEEDDQPSEERPDYSEFDNLAEEEVDEMIRDDIMDSEPELLPYVLAELKEKGRKKAAAIKAAEEAAKKEAEKKAALEAAAKAKPAKGTPVNKPSQGQSTPPEVVTGNSKKSEPNYQVTSNPSENNTTKSSARTENQSSKTIKKKTKKKKNKRNKNKNNKGSETKSSSSQALSRHELPSSLPYSSSSGRKPIGVHTPGEIPSSYQSSMPPEYGAGYVRVPARKRNGNIVHKLNKNILDKFGFGFSSSRPQPGSVFEQLLPSFLYDKIKTVNNDDDDDDTGVPYFPTPTQKYKSGFTYKYGRRSEQSFEEGGAEFNPDRQRINSKFRRLLDDENDYDVEIQNFVARKSRQLNMTVDPLEKYRVAVETGQKTKSARQCRFLFSSCPYTNEDVQAMIKNFQSFVIAQRTVGDKVVQLKKKGTGTSKSNDTTKILGTTKGSPSSSTSVVNLPIEVLSKTPIVQTLPAGDFEIKLKLKPKEEMIEITMGGVSGPLSLSANHMPADIRQALEAWTKAGKSKKKSVPKNETLPSKPPPIKNSTLDDTDIFDEDVEDATESSSNTEFPSDINLSTSPRPTSNTTTTVEPDKAFAPSNKSYNLLEGLPLLPVNVPVSAVYGSGSQATIYRQIPVVVDPGRKKGSKGKYRHSTTNKKYVGERRRKGTKSSADALDRPRATRRPATSVLPTRPTSYKLLKQSNTNSTSSGNSKSRSNNKGKSKSRPNNKGKGKSRPNNKGKGKSRSTSSTTIKSVTRPR